MARNWEDWDLIGGNVGSSKGKSSFEPRCYESHPVLSIGGGTLVGGSASYPMEKNADVYVSLNRGSTSGLSSDPWDEQKVVEVHYSITDMQAPTDLPRFKKLVTWLCNQLQSGRTVHVGCIGGHGRTGIVISALVAEIMGEKDAIQWVRKNYCKKAVESLGQIDWLRKNYGVSNVSPSKGETLSGSYRSGSGSGSGASTYVGNSGGYAKHTGMKPRSLPLLKGETEWPNTTPKKKSEGVQVTQYPSGTKSYAPMASARSLWNQRKKKKE